MIRLQRKESLLIGSFMPFSSLTGTGSPKPYFISLRSSKLRKKRKLSFWSKGLLKRINFISKRMSRFRRIKFLKREAEINVHKKCCHYTIMRCKMMSF